MQAPDDVAVSEIKQHHGKRYGKLQRQTLRQHK